MIFKILFIIRGSHTNIQIIYLCHFLVDIYLKHAARATEAQKCDVINWGGWVAKGDGWGVCVARWLSRGMGG